ncbi:MAG: hypothetical protein V2B18_23465 [Pseudomonadota bacterium]
MNHEDTERKEITKLNSPRDRPDLKPFKLIGRHGLRTNRAL